MNSTTLATKEDLSRFATKEDLSHFATEDLKALELHFIKWMIGIAGAIIGILFALLTFIPPAS